ncbi:MAG TPA: TolC family protein [Zeimonas sp.]|nr:TolC family protein [Zeimonas sp.]
MKACPYPNAVAVLVAAMALGPFAALDAPAQTLADALERAWAIHPQAGAWDQRSAEAQARADLAARATPGPAEVSVSSLDDRFDDDRGKREWELELAVPLWLPGQRAAHGDHARAAIDELAARREALRWRIAGELRAEWWSLASARSARALASRRAASARLLESDVLRRYAAGDLSRVDANLARDERIAAEAGLVEAETALLGAEGAYRALTGSDAPASLAEETIAVPPDATGRHPQLQALAAAARAARARLAVVDTSRREAPALAFRVVRERGEFAEPWGNAFGVKLTIPLSSGARVRQADAAARADAAQADGELARTRLQAKLDEQRARSELDAAERQLEMARERRAVTEDNLRLAEKSFALGETALFALLRARVLAFEAEAFLDRQQIERAAARSRLNQALGAMP